jgi:hypothetical protein
MSVQVFSVCILIFKFDVIMTVICTCCLVTSKMTCLFSFSGSSISEQYLECCPSDLANRGSYYCNYLPSCSNVSTATFIDEPKLDAIKNVHLSFGATYLILGATFLAESMPTYYCQEICQHHVNIMPTLHSQHANSAFTLYSHHANSVLTLCNHANSVLTLCWLCVDMYSGNSIMWRMFLLLGCRHTQTPQWYLGPIILHKRTVRISLHRSGRMNMCLRLSILSPMCLHLAVLSHCACVWAGTFLI